MVRVAVLGAYGMLGHTVTEWLRTCSGLEVMEIARLPTIPRGAGLPGRILDAETCGPEEIIEALAGAEWAINCIGVTKPQIDESDSRSIERAIRVNSLFPRYLATAAEAIDSQVIQIATDAVFSGSRGRYFESDVHDAAHVYGRSKSLGEVESSAVTHLRCSIVGPELATHSSLLAWFRSQPFGDRIQGFTDHHWNGITTLHFARLCSGLILSNVSSAGRHHILPSDSTTKADLLLEFGLAYGREDIEIDRIDSGNPVDMTLATESIGFNQEAWSTAGYDEPPSIRNMLQDLAKWEQKLYFP